MTKNLVKIDNSDCSYPLSLNYKSLLFEIKYMELLYNNVLI